MYLILNESGPEICRLIELELGQITGFISTESHTRELKIHSWHQDSICGGILSKDSVLEESIENSLKKVVSNSVKLPFRFYFEQNWRIARHDR